MRDAKCQLNLNNVRATDLSCGQKHSRSRLSNLNASILLLHLQLLDGAWLPSLPESPSFPALYRQHFYFLSSAEARAQFMSNPLAFLCQPSPKPVVPIRIALVGPPKSGKTTRTIAISVAFLVVLMSAICSFVYCVVLALHFVLAYCQFRYLLMLNQGSFFVCF